MEIKLLLKEKDKRIVVDNFRTGTLLAQGGAPRGPKGDQGVGVTSVELISVAGVNKTYRMHFSDSSYFDFVVKDGAEGLWGNIGGELSNQTDLQNALNAKQATISDLETIRSGAAAGATALQSTDITSTYSATGTDAVNGTAVASAISDKADTNLSNLTSTGESHFDSSYVKLQSGITQANVDYIVSSTHTSTSWCRVWKSGWCEQGALSDTIPGEGGLSITFLQEMADTNYAVFGGVVTSNTDGASRFMCYDRTTTGMIIDWSDATRFNKTWWEVKGFIAEEE